MAQQFCFVLEVPVVAHGQCRLGADFDLGNDFVLFDDFIHAALDGFYIVNGHVVADFQFTVEGFAQGVFDQYFAVGIEFGHGPHEEQDGRAYDALVAFQCIQLVPFDVSVFFYFRLQAGQFVIVQGGCHRRVGLGTALPAQGEQGRSFFHGIVCIVGLIMYGYHSITPHCICKILCLTIHSSTKKIRFLF